MINILCIILIGDITIMYQLPVLSYSYNEFEPYIDAETMRIHHTKHHQAYINNLNNILKSSGIVSLSIDDLMLRLDTLSVPQNIIFRNNAGGHANHCFFWKGLKKNTILSGSLKKSIEEQFISIAQFKDQFNSKAVNLFGSGWVWLVLKNRKLSIITTINQDNPLMQDFTTGVNLGYPIIGLDLWEHAYYLNYKNKRIDYIKSFWNIVNWEEASLLFDRQTI